MRSLEWWILGEVKIPEDKKEEFNGFVLELLDKGGIRKTKKIIFNGKEVTVVKKAVPDKKGIISFDYSIFEKKIRKVCTYNMHTCKLCLQDHGGNEFGMVMNLIMTLQESYTNGNCYLMYEDKPVKYIIVYLELLHSMLGRKLYSDNRGRVWDMFLFLKKENKSGQISKKELLRGVPFAYANFDFFQFMGFRELDQTKIMKCKEEYKIHKRDEIANAEYWGRKEYLYEILKTLQGDSPEELEDFLKELLDSDMNKRKEFAGREDSYGIIAELSLYMLPFNIVHTYAVARSQEFWETWDQFHIKGYKDTLVKMINEPEDESMLDENIRFYKAIQRETEDEFLEFWNGTNLVLSEHLKKKIESWKQRLQQMEDIQSIFVEEYLAEIIVDLDNDWQVRFADEEFIEQILNNRENILYRKALVLLREIMDEEIRYFPELTRRQAIEWIIKEKRDENENIIVMAYLSLFVNYEQRKIVLGF